MVRQLRVAYNRDREKTTARPMILMEPYGTDSLLVVVDTAVYVARRKASVSLSPSTAPKDSIAGTRTRWRNLHSHWTDALDV